MALTLLHRRKLPLLRIREPSRNRRLRQNGQTSWLPSRWPAELHRLAYRHPRERGQRLSSELVRLASRDHIPFYVSNITVHGRNRASLGAVSEASNTCMTCHKILEDGSVRGALLSADQSWKGACHSVAWSFDVLGGQAMAAVLCALGAHGHGHGSPRACAQVHILGKRLG